MIQKYVLIASTGKNDIKFWLKGIHEKFGEKLAVAQIQDKVSYKCTDLENTLSIRNIHQYLLDDKIKYSFSSNPEAALGVDYKTDILFEKNLKPHTYAEDNYQEDSLKPIQKDDKYLLYAAKLDQLIQTLKIQASQRNIQISGALFIGTARPKEQGEPIASHRLLAKHFAEQLSLNFAGELPEEQTGQSVATCPVYWVNQLKDLPDEQGNFYDGEGSDYPVKRIVAKRIDDSIKQFLANFESDIEVILSHTGGMHDLKDVLTASVFFRAPAGVLEIPMTEKNTRFGEAEFKKLIEEKHLISRRQSLQIKTLIQSRIKEGDIAGAWSACAHIHDDANLATHDIWTHAVKAVNSYYNSSEAKISDTILRRCPDDIKQLIDKLNEQLSELTQDETHLQQAQTTLTRTMFAIEASLQATKKQEVQVKQALTLCATLSDQLLRACVFKYLQEANHSYQLNTPLDYASDIVLGQKAPEGDKKFDKNNRKKLNIFYGREAWKNQLKQDNKLSVCIDYQNRMSCGKNTKHPSSYWKLQEWRNSIAHGRSVNETNQQEILATASSPVQCELNNQTINVKPLWNPNLLGFYQNNADAIATGDNFLNHYYVQQIEEKLGYGTGSTKKKYTQLQQTLLAIVQSPIYIPEQD